MSTLPAALDERLRTAVPSETIELLERRRRLVHRRGWLVRRALLAADLAGLTIAFTIADTLNGHVARGDHLTTATELAVFALSLPVWVVAAKLYGLYDRDEERADHSTADEMAGVFHLVTIATWLLFAGAYLTRLAAPTFPKLFTFWACAVVGVPLLRGGARAYCRRQINYLQNAVIVGTDAIGLTIARKLLAHPEYGINLVGFVDSRPEEPELGGDGAHLAKLGDCDDLPALIRLLDIERVIVAFPSDPHDRVLALVRELNGFELQVDLVPRLPDILSPSVDVHTVEGLPLIGLRPPSLSASSALLKRALDVVGATCGLLLLAPLFAVAAVAIAIESRGPVFFRQVRIGARGRPFHILKFRTMVRDADIRKDEVAHLNDHARRVGGDPRMFKIVNDPRVTRVGRLLRRFSIDELPQFWNVLRGEMSLVGPRPLIQSEHQHVVDWAKRRLFLKPGMTGLWQVLGRSAISFEEMVRLDYVYVTGWSLANDCRLLLRTLPVVLKGDARGY